MAIRDGARLALMLAAGLFVWFAQPSPTTAATDGEEVNSRPEDLPGAPLQLSRFGEHASRQSKSNAHRKSSQGPAKPPKSAESKPDRPVAVPPSVANANAELATGDNPAGSNSAMSARANDVEKNSAGTPAGLVAAPGIPILSADQLNDLDRALHEGVQPKPNVLASAEARSARVSPVMASTTEGSTWERTSPIGKIFVGLGVLLTLASAARMFMA